ATWPPFGPAFINSTARARILPNSATRVFLRLNEGKGGQGGRLPRSRLLAEAAHPSLGRGRPTKQGPDISRRIRLTKVQRSFCAGGNSTALRPSAAPPLISEVDAPVEFDVITFFLTTTKQQSMLLYSTQDENIEKISVAMKAKLPEEEQAQFVIAALDDLFLMCNKDLPEWEPGQSPVNELDLYLTSLRENQLKSIRAAATKLRAECTSVEEALNELDSFRSQIRAVAVEPQNSFPDVVIWMLCADRLLPN
uniref:FerA domain-containing protein n=1 Tax=Macrostomum lignano TaxID=282301 RepID=A0A1I8JMA2_9PLAT